MLFSRTPPPRKMKRTTILPLSFCSVLCVLAVGQSGPAPTAPSANQQYSTQGKPAGSTPSIEPVSYASVTQLNGLLAQLEAASKSTQANLVKLRIEHWKTDGASKRQALSNV